MAMSVPGSSRTRIRVNGPSDVGQGGLADAVAAGAGPPVSGRCGAGLASAEVGGAAQAGAGRAGLAVAVAAGAGPPVSGRCGAGLASAEVGGAAQAGAGRAGLAVAVAAGAGPPVSGRCGAGPAGAGVGGAAQAGAGQGSAAPLAGSGLAASAGIAAAAPPARIKLATLPTPLMPAPRLAGAMGIESLHVKRDDLTGFALGGNKARPLEFLVAAACAQGADTLVTGGAAGSNFCAMAAAAARRVGLACQLVIAGQPPQDCPGLDLARSWGARVSWTRLPDRASVDAGLPRVAAELSAAGRRPYLIPRGGATALGAVGYAVAAGELYDQLAGRGLRADCVLVAVGSGGTLAGLFAGNVLLGRPWRLLGAAVSRPAEETARRVLRLARDCLSLLAAPGGVVSGLDTAGQQAAGQASAGLAAAGLGTAGRVTGGPEAPGEPGAGLAITAGDFDLVDARGPGHGLASADGSRAADTALRTEGLMVDPVYTAKALAALQTVAAGRNAVFWHTGGLLDAIAAAGRTGDDA